MVDLQQLIVECLDRYESLGEAGIDQVCAQYPEHESAIRKRIESLRKVGLLDSAEKDEENFPEKLGDFRLIERLGGGGMGVVYLAEQVSLNRKIALKLIRPEQLFFPGARERFRRETEAVARLEHPGIVPLYSAGEENGIPYFAMQYVNGFTLAQILEKLQHRMPKTLRGEEVERILDRREQSRETESASENLPFSGSWEEVCIRLFKQIAEALAHAHRKGVVHRDLKPSNLIVTPAGRAMILDFGLASAEGMNKLTKTGSRLGSVPYMSPEQLRGDVDRIDARTDLYSLGVSLYEMLALRAPFDAATETLLRQRILDGDVDAIRRHNSAISWEAETVCLKAMDRDVDRRYASAADFARDLQNILEHRPIEARRPSVVLRAQRWVQRHPTATVALSLSFLIAAGLPSLIAFQQHSAKTAIQEEQARTEQARAKADANFQTARKAVDKMLSHVGQNTLAEIPQMESVRRELLEEALRFYQGFLLEKSDDPNLQEATADAYDRVAMIRMKLGQAEESEKAFRESIRLLEALLMSHPENPRPRRILAGSYSNLAILLRGRSRMDETMQLLEKSASLLQTSSENSQILPEETQRLVLTLNNLGTNLGVLGKMDEGKKILNQALKVQRRLLDQNPTDSEMNQELAGIHSNLGTLERLRGDWPGAEIHYQEAGRVWESLANKTPANAAYRREMARTQTNLASVLINRQQFDQGEAAMLRGIALREKLAEDFPGYPAHRFELAYSYGSWGNLIRQRDPQKAKEAFTKARDMAEKLVQDFPESTDYREALAGSLNNLGEFLLHQGDLTVAKKNIRRGIEIAEPLVRDHAQRPDYSILLAGLLNLWGALQDDLAPPEEATAAFERAELLIQSLLDKQISDPRLSPLICDIQSNLAETYLMNDSHAKADEVGKKILKNCAPGSTTLLRVAGILSRCATSTQDSKLAQDYLSRSLSTIQQAVKGGFSNFKELEESWEFAKLRETTEFQAWFRQAQAR